MNIDQVLALARKHVCDNPENESSARFCLADAVKVRDEGSWEYARQRALKSLAYSVSAFHNDYKRVDSLRFTD
jgi:hypothetical protein